MFQFQNIKRVVTSPAFPLLLLRAAEWARSGKVDNASLLDAVEEFVACELAREGGVSPATIDAVRGEAHEAPVGLGSGRVVYEDALDAYRAIFVDPSEEALDAVDRGALYLMAVNNELRAAVIAAGEAGADLSVRAIPGGIAVAIGERSLPFVLGRDGAVRLGGELVSQVSPRNAVRMALATLMTPRVPRGGGGPGGQVVPFERDPKGPKGDAPGVPGVPAQNAPTSPLLN